MGSRRWQKRSDERKCYVCVAQILFPVVHPSHSPGRYLGGGAVDVREEGGTSFAAAVDSGTEIRRQFSEDIV